MKSQAASPAEYLAELPSDRRAVVALLRDIILENLPQGYVEAMRWGMLSYEVPLSKYADTYNKQPLSYIGLASQKNHFALYLTGVYADSEGYRALGEAFREEGKKFDMGKSCLRFRSLEQLPLKRIGEAIASLPVDEFIALYRDNRRGT